MLCGVLMLSMGEEGCALQVIINTGLSGLHHSLSHSLMSVCLCVLYKLLICTDLRRCVVWCVNVKYG